MNIIPGLKRILTPEKVSRCLLLCCVPAVMFYVVSVAVMSMAGFSLIEILRDPAQQTGHHSFLGFVSTIGTWLWLAGATLCFFRVTTYEKPQRDAHKMLLILVGGFSFFLAFDDYFLIHDRYITEGILFPLYALYLGFLLKRYHAKILEIDGFAFFLAGSMLALSVIVDSVQDILPVAYRYSQVLEEGFKFVGAAAWLYFCFRIAAYRQDAPAQ